jgi:hypothetical protein
MVTSESLLTSDSLTSNLAHFLPVALRVQSHCRHNYYYHFYHFRNHLEHLITDLHVILTQLQRLVNFPTTGCHLETRLD